MALYAVYPHNTRVSPNTRAFVDFLVALFAGKYPAGARPARRKAIAARVP